VATPTDFNVPPFSQTFFSQHHCLGWT